ncbi:putative fructokinase-4 [Citrus sinensis]|uniref:Fructokinase-4 n=1 Tax=Citrus sinensis TaxID=2711 RepID=A0ACB8MD87_CITSI|nr:putative fructokinase-4 [Citrus sinensis]
MATNGAVSSSSSLIVSFGEMLIDFVPTVSGVSLAEAPGFLKAPGGAPANVAIAVARLGGKAAFVGKLGDDEFGHMLAGILKENGVSADGINFDQGARTALAFVTLRADGEREFMFYRNPSADMLLRPDELNLELIRSAKVFHYGSISLIVEPCRSAHLEAMKAAKEAGALLSYDPNLRLPLWPSPEEAREQIMSIWDKAEVIKVSDVELEFLTGSDKIDDESALSLWHPNLKLLLVTLGEHGCRYYTKLQVLENFNSRKKKKSSEVMGKFEVLVRSVLLVEEPLAIGDVVSWLDVKGQGLLLLFKSFFLGTESACSFRGAVDAFHVNTVDTTGAGDAFVGALLGKLVDDQSVLEDEPRLREILKFANACGAITTTKKGAIPALPTESEALNLLKGA